MRQQQLTKWTLNNATEGLLFFAESIDELCFDHTLDSYRAPALNLHTSALEVESLAQFYAEHEKLGRSALATVTKELLWHIANDPVVRLKKRAIAKEFAHVINPEMRPADLAAYVEALIAEIRSFYWEELNALLIEACADPKRKKDIHALATAFVGETELAGFPRAYLYRVNRAFFFSAPSPEKITAPDQVVDFLKAFQREVTEWSVVFRSSTSFDRFSKYHNTYWFEVTQNVPDELKYAPRKPTQFLRADAQRPRFIIFKGIKAKCPNAARETGITLDL